MRFDICESDYRLLASVLTIFREKGGRNASITRSEIIRESGLTYSHMSKKIKNSYLLEKKLKEIA